MTALLALYLLAGAVLASQRLVRFVRHILSEPDGPGDEVSSSSLWGLLGFSLLCALMTILTFLLLMLVLPAWDLAGCLCKKRGGK